MHSNIFTFVKMNNITIIQNSQFVYHIHIHSMKIDVTVTVDFIETTFGFYQIFESIF